MTKKQLIILSSMIVLVIVVIIILISTKGNKKEEVSKIKEAEKTSSEDINMRVNDDGEYEVYNNKTDQLITTIEDPGEFKKYQETPDYADYAPKIQ